MRNRWLKGSLLLVVGLLALVGWSGSARADEEITYPSYAALFQVPNGTSFKATRADGSSTVYPLFDSDGNEILDATAFVTPNNTQPVMKTDALLNLKKGTLNYLAIPPFKNKDNGKEMVASWFPVNDQTLLISGGTVSAPKADTKTEVFNFSFKDESGNDIPGSESESIRAQYQSATGSNVDPFEDLATSLTAQTNGKLVTSLPIDGYTLAEKDPLTSENPIVDGDTTTYNYTYHYTKDIATGGNTNTSGIAGTSGTATMPTADSSSSAASQATTTKASVQRKAVYAVKKIGLYSQPTFTKQSRTRWFTKQTRPNRPTFTVIGYARSKAGNLRYKVRTADGTTGYITTRSAYVTNAYYQHKPAMVKVISAKGLNAYGNVVLNGKKLRHYARGSVVTVKAIKTHGLTTRLVLTNGRYITGNKTFVIAK